MKLMLQGRPVIVGIVIVASLFFPLSIIHEFGHIIICVSGGHTYILDLSLIVFNVCCNETPSNFMLYYAFGGGFAMLVSLAPFLAWNWIRQHKGIIIGLLTIATLQGANAIVETGWHIWYVNNTSTSMALLSIILGLSFIGYIFLFARVGR